MELKKREKLEQEYACKPMASSSCRFVIIESQRAIIYIIFRQYSIYKLKIDYHVIGKLAIDDMHNPKCHIKQILMEEPCDDVVAWLF